MAGFVNVVAGGGSLVTLPVLIFLGMPAALANGTNRIGILVQNTVAIWDFRRLGHSDHRTGFRLALATLPGAILGAWLSVRIPETWFRAALAGVLVLSVIAMLLPAARVEGTATEPRLSPLTVLAFFGIGLYGGFVQAGVGFLLMALLYQGLRIDLVRVNVYKVVVVAWYTLPALAVFLWTANVDWTAGLVLAAGNAVGAVLGTRLSVRGGERLIRTVFAVALLAMAVRLLWP